MARHAAGRRRRGRRELVPVLNTLVSIFQIEATCGYCLASFVLMNVLLVLVLLRRPERMPEYAWRKALPLPIGAVVAVVLGLQLHFSGVFDPAAGPEDPHLKALATHLRDSGARFYGAYWCPACQEQKSELFAAPPSIGCRTSSAPPKAAADPVRSIASQARLENIEQYPTWIIDGQRQHPHRSGRRRKARPAVELQRSTGTRPCALVPSVNGEFFAESMN